MALTTKDVITQDFVRETVEEVMEENLVYRQAFQEISATDIQSNSYTFQIENDDMGDMVEVGENQEFQRDQDTVREVTVSFTKYGKEIAITMEAMSDTMIDMKARQVEKAGRRMAEHLNNKAFEELNNNVGSTVGDNDNVLSFSDIRDGVIAIRNEDYTPDLMIVDIDGYGDLMTDSNFNRATESGDELVRTGVVGEIAGMDVVIDNTNDIADGNGAFLVDTGEYGYELTRDPVSTNEYEAPERQADVVQVWTRKAWKAIFPEAAVKIDA